MGVKCDYAVKPSLLQLVYLYMQPIWHYICVNVITFQISYDTPLSALAGICA